MEALILFFLVWLPCSIFIGWLASKRGRSGLGWWFLSLLISPVISLFALLLMQDLAAEAIRLAREESRFRDQLAVLSDIKATMHTPDAALMPRPKDISDTAAELKAASQATVAATTAPTFAAHQDTRQISATPEPTSVPKTPESLHPMAIDPYLLAIQSAAANTGKPAALAFKRKPFNPMVIAVGALAVAVSVLAFYVFQLQRSMSQQPTTAEVAIPAAPATKVEPLKIAFAYVSAVGDGGWTFAHDNGRKALEKEFGEKIVTTFVENVPESGDAEGVIRDMVSQGNKLIFGTTFGYMEPMLKVAADTKGVNFQHASGYTTAENMSTYDSRSYEGAYMAGVIAGAMTVTNTLGVVGSIPIPEILRNINAFTLGAQSSNPKVKTNVIWVNGWFDPPNESEAATSLINGGADVLFQQTDSPAVLHVAQARGKRAFGWQSDMTAYGPQAHLASSIINWPPYYIKTTRDALEGKNASTRSWWGVKEGAIDIVSIAKDVPAETKAKVAEVKKGLKDGTFVIWKGPIMDNTGNQQIAKGAAADDNFLEAMSFYVKGVEARVPGSKPSPVEPNRNVWFTPESGFTECIETPSGPAGRIEDSKGMNPSVVEKDGGRIVQVEAYRDQGTTIVKWMFYRDKAECERVETNVEMKLADKYR